MKRYHFTKSCDLVVDLTWPLWVFCSKFSKQHRCHRFDSFVLTLTRSSSGMNSVYTEHKYYEFQSFPSLVNVRYSESLVLNPKLMVFRSFSRNWPEWHFCPISPNLHRILIRNERAKWQHFKYVLSTIRWPNQLTTLNSPFTFLVLGHSNLTFQKRMESQVGCFISYALSKIHDSWLLPKS